MTDASSGDGVSARPSSSSTTWVSARVKPAPPCSSGIARAATPIWSQSVDHRSVSNPAGSLIAFRTAWLSERLSSRARTELASSVCSRVGTRAS